MLMRMICDDYLSDASGIGGAGVEDVRWRKPVRPGDVLSARRTCLEARRSQSRPSMGITKLFYEVINQNDDVVMTWVAVQIFESRTTPENYGDTS
jgi:acyl dehydratase